MLIDLLKVFKHKNRNFYLYFFNLFDLILIKNNITKEFLLNIDTQKSIIENINKIVNLNIINKLFILKIYFLNYIFIRKYNLKMKEIKSRKKLLLIYFIKYLAYKYKLDIKNVNNLNNFNIFLLKKIKILKLFKIKKNLKKINNYFNFSILNERINSIDLFFHNKKKNYANSTYLGNFFYFYRVMNQNKDYLFFFSKFLNKILKKGNKLNVIKILSFLFKKIKIVKLNFLVILKSFINLTLPQCGIKVISKSKRQKPFMKIEMYNGSKAIGVLANWLKEANLKKKSKFFYDSLFNELMETLLKKSFVYNKYISNIVSVMDLSRVIKKRNKRKSKKKNIRLKKLKMQSSFNLLRRKRKVIKKLSRKSIFFYNKNLERAIYNKKYNKLRNNYKRQKISKDIFSYNLRFILLTILNNLDLKQDLSNNNKSNYLLNKKILNYFYTGNFDFKNSFFFDYLFEYNFALKFLERYPFLDFFLLNKLDLVKYIHLFKNIYFHKYFWIRAILIYEGFFNKKSKINYLDLGFIIKLTKRVSFYFKFIFFFFNLMSDSEKIKKHISGSNANVYNYIDSGLNQDYLLKFNNFVDSLKKMFNFFINGLQSLKFSSDFKKSKYKSILISFKVLMDTLIYDQRSSFIANILKDSFVLNLFTSSNLKLFNYISNFKFYFSFFDKNEISNKEDNLIFLDFKKLIKTVKNFRKNNSITNLDNNLDSINNNFFSIYNKYILNRKYKEKIYENLNVSNIFEDSNNIKNNLRMFRYNKQIKNIINFLFEINYKGLNNYLFNIFKFFRYSFLDYNSKIINKLKNNKYEKRIKDIKLNFTKKYQLRYFLKKLNFNNLIFYSYLLFFKDDILNINLKFLKDLCKRINFDIFKGFLINIFIKFKLFKNFKFNKKDLNILIKFKCIRENKFKKLFNSFLRIYRLGYSFDFYTYLNYKDSFNQLNLTKNFVSEINSFSMDKFNMEFSVSYFLNNLKKQLIFDFSLYNKRDNLVTDFQKKMHKHFLILNYAKNYKFSLYLFNKSFRNKSILNINSLLKNNELIFNYKKITKLNIKDRFNILFIYNTRIKK